jgi:hypothetical protein
VAKPHLKNTATCSWLDAIDGAVFTRGLHKVFTNFKARVLVFNMAAFGEEIDFREEAKSIISDISFAVRRIDVSRTLDNSKDCTYMNIITLEGLTMCVQLNIHGLKVGCCNFVFTNSL